MSRLSRIKATTSNIVSKFTRKQSYNSGDDNITASTGGRYNSYTRLAHRQTNNLSYKQYRDIMKDPQVKVGLEILKYFLISKNYVLTSDSDDEISIEITDFIQESLDNMETPFRDVIKNILTAIRYGYSVQEKVYTMNTDNRITIKGLYPIHIKTLQNDPFIRDKTGELTGIHQESMYGTVDIPIDKCLLYSFDKEFDEIEGNSILNEIKPIAEDKEDIKDWLMTFLNKNESPTTYAKTDDPTHAPIIQESLNNISAGATNIVVGTNDELGILESSHRGEAYFTTLNYNDNQIFRRMFLGSLLLGSGDQTGSYAQSYTQENVLFQIMDGILTDIAQIIQRTVVNDLTSMNFGLSAKSPSFSFEKFTKKDVLKLLEIVKGFIDNGSFDSDNQSFKELLGAAFLTEADIKLDLDNVTDTTQTLNDETNFDYQPPLPGESEANDLINEQLEGIV
ncbi:hypothetical protein [uncultured Methanobrevibacter sp.]|uniref:phage portal protein family protein n=1 Tax=uncultured Methanobrevibacter sp. TaxID=253161 RepID=UPI0025D85593|nr:hypothetical protein [uncultured Methanobrevibacter sp.]